MLLAFAMSMDDVIISVFVTGVDTNTLPVKIYSQLKTGVTPGDKRPVHLAFPGHFAAVRAGRPGGQDAKKTRFWKGRDRAMKKILSMALAALLLVGTLGGCSSSGGENGQLVLYTWENMFPQEVLDGFTQETGISVDLLQF